MTETTTAPQPDPTPTQPAPLFAPYPAPLAPNPPQDPAPEQDPPPAPEPDVEQVDQAQNEPHRYFHRVRAVAGHEHTRTAVRHAAYVGTGAMTAAKHRKDERSTARHHRMMVAAEAAGNHEMALEWEQRASHHRAERHRRRMELLKHAPLDVLRALVTGGVAIAGTLLVLGMLLAANSHQV